MTQGVADFDQYAEGLHDPKCLEIVERLGSKTYTFSKFLNFKHSPIKVFNIHILTKTLQLVHFTALLPLYW